MLCLFARQHREHQDEGLFVLMFPMFKKSCDCALYGFMAAFRAISGSGIQSTHPPKLSGCSCLPIVGDPARRNELASRVGDPLWSHPAQGLGRQPDLGGGAGAVGPDVGVADVQAAGALGPGLPQSTPARHAGAVGFTPLTHGAKPVLLSSGPYHTDGRQSGRQPLRRGGAKRIDVSFVLLLGLVSLA
jgi:hypothetical protein